jgi:hypothetical protein
MQKVKPAPVAAPKPTAKIVLDTKNSNGVYHTAGVNKKGKPIEEVRYTECVIANKITGEIISPDISPKYKGLTYQDYKAIFDYDESIRYLEPMSCHEPENYEDDEVADIAELKRDGHRGLIYIGVEQNRCFSRTISKVSGWFSENSDCVPHIRDLDLTEFEGTVLDGEFDYGTTSMGVQSVMGANPDTAIQFQWKNGFIPFYAFDILYYKGINIQRMPLWKRKIYLARVLMHIQDVMHFPLIHFQKMFTMEAAEHKLMTEFENYLDGWEDEDVLIKYLSRHMEGVESYREEFKRTVIAGLEGLIIKKIDSPYEQKKSNYWWKLKGCSTWDVVFMGTTEPTREYEGKLVEEGRIGEWKYWFNPETQVTRMCSPTSPTGGTMLWKGFIPVSKPFAMEWCGGIRCGVFKKMDDKMWEEWVEYCGGSLHAEAYLDQMQDEGDSFFIDNNRYVLVEVATAKGLDEDTMDFIKKNHYNLIGKVLEIEANGIIDNNTGSLFEHHVRALGDEKREFLNPIEE